MDVLKMEETSLTSSIFYFILFFCIVFLCCSCSLIRPQLQEDKTSRHLFSSHILTSPTHSFTYCYWANNSRPFTTQWVWNGRFNTISCSARWMTQKKNCYHNLFKFSANTIRVHVNSGRKYATLAVVPWMSSRRRRLNTWARWPHTTNLTHPYS